MNLPRYSMGIGDRFGRQGAAQLSAFVKARDLGMEIAPVWNKSFREHSIVGTTPGDVRTEADSAVAAQHWTPPYFVDADHISLKNVDGFIGPSDFFTLDVADFVGKAAGPNLIADFVQKHSDLIGRLQIPGIDQVFEIDRKVIEDWAGVYLLAVREAASIFRHINDSKSADSFVVEVSMDETDTPQTPLDLLFILAAIADHGIPAQTVAPKFSGRFNKGVDYQGDVDLFAREFEQDVLVVAHARERFGLPANLKLSVHSGSDKFSLYPHLHRIIRARGAGLHLKTAGTTWLEEVIGLCESEGDGLAVAKHVYATAFDRFEEMCGPYATVIDIDRSRLPAPATVNGWTGDRFAAALRHDRTCREYHPHLRQLLHVGYKVAADMGAAYLSVLDRNESTVSECVTGNILDRHILPLFIGTPAE